MESKLIIVSNRLPFRIEKKGEGLEIKKSTGGLVSALESTVHKNSDVVWVGCADFSKDIWNQYSNKRPDDSFSIVPLFLEKKLEKKYYNGFSNTIIWPLFHYFPSYAEYTESFFDAYRQVNELFAERISAIVQPGDRVWIHDYHLMLLPAMLRDAHRDLSTGFFLHIPFPSYEILKLIPESWRNELLESLLQANITGFHTSEYVSHFKRSVSYFLGVELSDQTSIYKENPVVVKDYPISIDFEKFNSAWDLPAVKKGRKQIRERYNGIKLIFSVDRLDYTKGVMNRLQAFEELLNERPELKQKITFVVNVVPSRDKHSKYAERRSMIEEKVGHLNGLHGNVSWQPVIYQYSHLSFTQLLSFYTACDIALVTPLRDGMNLVAKEFVASRKDKRGVLILSEFAGAANELKEAILVNPNDNNLMKNAMLHAIQLSPEEQQKAMEAMQETIRNNDVKKWTDDFINDLNISRIMSIQAKVRIMSFEERIELVEKYRSADHRLILLDYDGTLVPYYNSPQDAMPGLRVKGVLTELAANPKNRVVIISGRDTKTLEQWFGDTPVDLVAEHGGFYRSFAEGVWTGVEAESSNWKGGVKGIFEKWTSSVPGTFIEEKEHSVAWHYRTANDFNEQEAIHEMVKDLMILNANNRFKVMCGNKVVEVKSGSFDKGSFAIDFVGKYNFDFVMAIGDDVTDEDMFEKLRAQNHFTIRVGLGQTKAMYNLIGVNNVHSFLDQLSAFKNVMI